MTHSKHTDYTERSKEWMKEYKLRAYKFENDPDVALRSMNYAGIAEAISRCEYEENGHGRRR